MYFVFCLSNCLLWLDQNEWLNLHTFSYIWWSFSSYETGVHKWNHSTSVILLWQRKFWNSFCSRSFSPYLSLPPVDVTFLGYCNNDWLFSMKCALGCKPCIQIQNDRLQDLTMFNVHEYCTLIVKPLNHLFGQSIESVWIAVVHVQNNERGLDLEMAPTSCFFLSHCLALV